MEKLKRLQEELKHFCNENNISEGKSGYLMGLFVKHSEALRQPVVSGNEGILPLSENKKENPEVALPPANHRWEIADEHWEICRCGCGLARERRQ